MGKSVICVDAMGGDFAPVVTTKGAIKALNVNENIEIVLVGREDLIKANLKDLTYDEKRLRIVNATEVIENEESPTKVIKEKKDSSMIVGLNLVKNGDADAFVSAGSTGALLTASTLIIGRIKGVKRAVLATLVPTVNKRVLLLDCGSNADCRPEYLEQFAIIGSAYMEKIENVKNPSVALLNIGSEDTKGNTLTKETFPLLSNLPINFVGNIEANNFPKGEVDVVVTDGFTGNVVLKLSEGMLKSFSSLLKTNFKKNLFTMAGAVIGKSALNGVKNTFDIEDLGGAPFLGLNSLVVKAHGSSNEKEITAAILQCDKFIQSNFTNNLADALKN